MDSTDTLDLVKVRAQFPALRRTGPAGLPIIHADAPGGTQIVAAAIDAMTEYLTTSNANSHGQFDASRRTDALVDDVRRKAAAFTGGDPDGIVFGPNMTTLTWHLSHALDRRVGPSDEIVCTRLDHDANVAPWLALAARTGATIRWVELGDGGRLRTSDIPVTDRTRLVAFPAASNALGTVVDPAPFVAAARSVGALTFCDAVHAAPHVALDRRGWGIDVLACSPYKFFGPHSGLLSADPSLLASLTPDKVRPSPEQGPDRWQTGTAAFEDIAGIGAALDYIAGVGMDAVIAHERGLTQRFLDGIAELDHITLHGPPTADARTPTFAITAAGTPPPDVSAALAERGILSWSGHYYAIEPMAVLGLLDHGGAVRIGFVHYHSTDDVDRVLEGLAALA